MASLVWQTRTYRPSISSLYTLRMDSKNAAGTHSREASVVGLSPSQKTKRRKTKTIYFDLFLLNVSILSKCSKRLSFKGVKFSVSERGIEWSHHDLI